VTDSSRDVFSNHFYGKMLWRTHYPALSDLMTLSTVTIVKLLLV